MKRKFVASLIAGLMLVQIMVLPAFAVETQCLDKFCETVGAETGYTIEVINLNGRASGTATIQGETVAVVGEVYTLSKGEHLGISFEMSKKYDDVDVAIGQASNLTTFIVPTITSSGVFNKTYTYSGMITAGVAGDYDIAIRNSGTDSISISNIKITKG